MRLLTRVTLACVIAALAGYAAEAQGRSSPCGEAERTFGSLKIATSAECPFSAEIEVDRTETLSDGTHLTSKNKGSIHRDSAGRVYYELYAATPTDRDAHEKPFTIEIYDPVGGFRYELQPNSKIFHRIAIDESEMSARAASEAQRTAGVPSASLPKKKSRVERINETRSPDAELEPREIEGYMATGKRIINTIAAGTNGNDRAITIALEDWSSAELGATLVYKRSDPRFGDFVTRMKNIERSEPDPALFEVPKNYTVEDQ